MYVYDSDLHHKTSENTKFMHAHFAHPTCTHSTHYTHTYTHTYTPTCTPHTRTYLRTQHTHAWTHPHAHMDIHTHGHTYTHIHTHKHGHMHTRMDTCTHAWTHTHTHMHGHTHIHTLQQGLTALHFAAWKGHVEVVEMLIKEGASPFVQSQSGKTPLQLAQEDEHQQCVLVLQAATSKVREVKKGASTWYCDHY